MTQTPYRTEFKCGCAKEEFPLCLFRIGKYNRVTAKDTERFPNEPCPKYGHPSGVDLFKHSVCEKCNLIWRPARIERETCSDCVFEPEECPAQT
jgi:hypothetical protein